MILAISGRLSFIAPLGQNSWQQKQRMHAFLFMDGFPLRMVIAFAGQILKHFSQPMHSLRLTRGRDASAPDTKLPNHLPKTPGSSMLKAISFLSRTSR
jgi:hypothetical protein